MVFNPVLFWAMGITGPAIATFLSIFIVNMGQLVMTARSTGISLSKVFPWKSLGEIGLINVLLACCFGALKQLLPLDLLVGSLVESLVLGALWTLLYAVIMRNRLFWGWRTFNVGRSRQILDGQDSGSNDTIRGCKS